MVTSKSHNYNGPTEIVKCLESAWASCVLICFLAWPYKKPWHARCQAIHLMYAGRAYHWKGRPQIPKVSFLAIIRKSRHGQENAWGLTFDKTEATWSHTEPHPTVLLDVNSVNSFQTWKHRQWAFAVIGFLAIFLELNIIRASSCQGSTLAFAIVYKNLATLTPHCRNLLHHLKKYYMRSGRISIGTEVGKILNRK